MILMNTIDGDVSTADVIRWLWHFKKPFIRLNENDTITGLSIKDATRYVLHINGQKEIHTSDIKSYWYRRGQLNIHLPGANTARKRSSLSKKVHDYSVMDKDVILSLLYNKLAAIKHIGRFETSTFVNKLFILEQAERSGITVPATLVTCFKKDLQQFQKKHGKIVTKAISESFSYVSGDYWLPSYTQEITNKQIAKLPATFGLSLFQQQINKKIEIRSFYLHGEFYSMAIFSQNDPKTRADFRNYNYKKPNRNVPYKLPASLEKKLDALMHQLSFQSGSIDLLLDENDTYYFLEINPVGQFGALSQQCNYQLEKKIALYLSDEK